LNRYSVIIEEDGESDFWDSKLIIQVDGKNDFEWSEAWMEPEDARLCRDLYWIEKQLTRAYNLGVEHGREEYANDKLAGIS